MSVDYPACREIHRGVTFGFWGTRGYFLSDKARHLVDRMLDLNINWCVLTPLVMQDTPNTPRQYFDYELCPTDYEIETIIEYIHGKNIRVDLRPMIECQTGDGRLQVGFPPDRERIPGRRSDCWERWFRSMRARSVHYAEIAERRSCEMYCLDSELDLTVGHTTSYKQVIEAVRQVYRGPVSSCHTSHTGLVDFEKSLADSRHWFHELDVLQISCYAQGADRPGASVPEIIERLKPERDRFRRMAGLFGKPILFGEVGCTSSHGGAMHPSGWSGDGGYAPNEQANYLEAVLETFWPESWWTGLYWWKWDENINRPQWSTDPAGNKGFTLLDKPAAEVMRRWFARKDRP